MARCWRANSTCRHTHMVVSECQLDHASLSTQTKVLMHIEALSVSQSDNPEQDAFCPSKASHQPCLMAWLKCLAA